MPKIRGKLTMVGEGEVETGETWEEEEELAEDGGQAQPWSLCLCLQEEAARPRGWSGQGTGEPVAHPSTAGLGRGAEGKVRDGTEGSRTARLPGIRILGLRWI